MEMKKTSVYLSEEGRERLARIAEQKGESQAWVIREALMAYDASSPQPDRDFAILEMKVEPGYPGIPRFEDPQEFQDWLDNEGLKGFGADSVDYEPARG